MWHSDIAQTMFTQLERERLAAGNALRADEVRLNSTAQATATQLVARRLHTDFQRRQIEEFERLALELQLAIRKVAETEGFDFVFPEALLVKPAWDTTQHVLTVMIRRFGQ